MNRRIDFIDIIKSNINTPECRLFLEKLHSYYIVNDIETNYIHSKIFHALYLDGIKTYDEIAQTLGINLYSLDRYRKRYNQLATSIAPETLKEKYNIISKIRY